ncbi:hypothetical protein HMPREF1502_2518 [Klebsiella sp. AS10]|nr:hypothetical protein HMPREF1502_2518 [Klebsiella sp. AS10]
MKSLHDIPPVFVYFAAGLAKTYHCSFIGKEYSRRVMREN